jgi:hypothetical protein
MNCKANQIQAPEIQSPTAFIAKYHASFHPETPTNPLPLLFQYHAQPTMTFKIMAPGHEPKSLLVSDEHHAPLRKIHPPLKSAFKDLAVRNLHLVAP